jgi:putative flavoprotein involved in K+ transport
VLVVGTGQSGTEIAEELHQSGRQIHLAVSMCPSAPRRYRGRDVIWWLLQCFLHGADAGVPFPIVEALPSPAARFGCDPHVSGTDGGHDINLRQFARQGVHLYGRLESASGGAVRFSDDLDERLAYADRGFDEQFRPMFDAYIAAPASRRHRMIGRRMTTSLRLPPPSLTWMPQALVQRCGRRVISSTSAG